MASISSNLSSEIAPLIRDLGNVLNLNRAKGGKRLGDEVAETIAAGIQHRSIEGQSYPDGGAWPDITRRTKVRKAMLGQPETIGVATGEMLDFSQLKGMVAIGDDEMEMEYGIDEEVKEKAEHFSEKREFYDLDADIEKDVMQLMGEAVEDGIRDLGGA